MKTISMGAADSVYTCNQINTIDVHRVSFPELGAFSQSLNQFGLALGESAADDYWRSILQRLKSFRFEACAAPLSEHYLAQLITDISQFVRGKLGLCYSIHPEYVDHLERIVNQFENLAHVKLDHLLEAVLDLASNMEGIPCAILLKESRHIHSVEQSIGIPNMFGGWDIVTESSLRSDTCYNAILVIGPPRWFPEYIFSAPRAKLTHLIQYSWIRGRSPEMLTFASPFQSHQERRNEKLSRPWTIQEEPLETADPADILPIIDIDRAIATAHAESERDDEEVVEARLLVLEQRWAVFLDANENSTVLVIDIESDSTDQVQKAKVRDVEPGMFVLLRTEGGGDFIVPVADRIMGANAHVARTKQITWKSKLREQVQTDGMPSVVRKLQEYGSKIANETNVRNWMSYRTIKTQDEADFKALMHLLGLAHVANDYWQAMDLISRAHRRAGFHIRDLLIQHVNNSDLGELQRTGKMEFELPDRDAGSLTAFRIQTIASETVSVVAWRIGDPFELE